MPEELKTPQQLAAEWKAKFPKYKDAPDGILVADILKKFPKYREHLNLGPAPPQEEESALSQAATGFHMLGPQGMAEQAFDAMKPSLKNLAMIAAFGPMAPAVQATLGAKDMLGQIAEAGKFYQPLFVPTQHGAKGTITEPGMGTAIKEAAPTIAGGVAGLAADELLFRGAPPLARAAKPLVGKYIATAGRVAEAHPYLVGGPAGAAIGKVIEHPYVGYMAGAGAAKTVGRWMQKFGARLAETHPGQVDALGPIPGTPAFEVFAKDIFGPDSPAAKGSPNAQARAVKLLEEHGVAEGIPKDVATRLIAGGSGANEFVRLRPEFEPRAQALLQELSPGDLRAQSAKEYASHAIPAINDFMDRYKPGVQIKSPADALAHGEDALSAIWTEHEKMVKPIAGKRMSLAGAKDEIGKKFDSMELAQNSNLREQVTATLKDYATKKFTTVDALFKRVTQLNKDLRSFLPYEVRRVKGAELDSLRPRLYDAFKEHLPTQMYDEAILTRQKYGAVKEFLKDLKKGHGHWLKAGMNEAVSRNKALKGVKMNQVFEDVFKHQKGKSQTPTEFKPTSAPVTEAKPVVATKVKTASTTAKVTPATAPGQPTLEQLHEYVEKMNADISSRNPSMSVEEYMIRKEAIDKRIAELQGVKPTTVSDKFASTGKGKPNVAPESAARTRSRREAMKTEAAVQQEKQLGGGRKKKIPSDE